MFEEITISNFRSCESVRLEAACSVLALVGRNGAGKTNILTAIHWLCQSATSAEAVRRLGGVFARPADPSVEAVMRLGNDRYVYRLTFRGGREATSPSDASFPEKIEEVFENLTASRALITRDGENVRVVGRAEPIRIAATTPALAALPSLLPIDDEAIPAIGKLSSFFANVHYYELGDATNESYYVTREQYNEWRKDYERNRTATPSVALRLLHMWESDRAAFEEVQTILGDMEIIDRITVHEVDISTQVKKTTTDASKLYLFFFSPSRGVGGYGQSFGFDDLSAGTRRIVRMIVSLIFDKRSVMLVEQPEDMIHRGMLLKVLDVFRTYTHDTQLIFTTHSSVVLNMLTPQEVRLVSAEDGVTQARRMTADEIARAGSFLNESGSLSDFVELLEDNE
jgi:predicted ATPase